jgi:hypothetical protein
MGVRLALFTPELIVLCAVILVVPVFLLVNIRSFVRNTLGAAVLLFAWAMRAEFVGFVAYLAGFFSCSL